MPATRKTARTKSPASVRKPANPTPNAKGAARASQPASGHAASALIDQRIRDLADWRGETLERMRKLILAADPEAIEEWKWRGTPVWSHDGILCTGETYAKVVKLTFARGG